MPRKYIRKEPERCVVTNDQFNAAKLLISQGATKRQAAIKVGLKESTLRKRLIAGYTVNNLGRFSPTFTAAQETEICDYKKLYDNLFYGINTFTLRKLIYEYAETKQIPHRFNKSSEIAGRDWIYGFLKRHPDLKLLQESTQTSVPRAIKCVQTELQAFYKNLQAIYNEHHFPPSRIFNLGAICVYMDPDDPPKIISFKDKKSSAKFIAGRTGQTVTLLWATSASGYYVPPAFIFPRKIMRDYLMNNASEGSIGMVSDSGLLNKVLFIGYLNHFSENVEPTKDDPVLLILGNLTSNISLAAVNYCQDNNIHMLTLPPRNGDKMQPLHLGFFGPLITNFSLECDKWLSLHQNRTIGQAEVAHLINESSKEAASLKNAEIGFVNSGIWPIDEKKILDTYLDDSDVSDS